jgi:hypothetical protein
LRQRQVKGKFLSLWHVFVFSSSSIFSGHLVHVVINNFGNVQLQLHIFIFYFLISFFNVLQGPPSSSSSLIGKPKVLYRILFVGCGGGESGGDDVFARPRDHGGGPSRETSILMVESRRCGLISSSGNTLGALVTVTPSSEAVDL